MQKTKIFLSAFALMFSLIVLAHVRGQSEGQVSLFPIYLEKKGGYINEHGKVIISPQFDSVGDFSEGMAAVKLDDKWGYIDKSGTLNIPPNFEAASKFSEGAAIVLIAGKYGYVDRSGKIIITPKFQRAGNFSEGLACVRVNDSWGYINKNGEIAIPPGYDYVDDFHNGLAVVAKGNGDGTCRVAYINKSGKQMFDKWFVSATSFSEGIAFVSNDSNGFSTIAHEALTLDNYDLSSGPQKPMHFEIINSEGRKISEGDYQEVDVFSDGLAAVRLNDKYGYINIHGAFVISPRFDTATRFSEGLALVSLGVERFYIDQTDRRSLSTSYSDNFPFSNNLVFVKDCSDHILPCKGGYIDKKGETIWAPTR
jgi:hypothetical protein